MRHQYLSTALVFMLISSQVAAETVKTSIDVVAEISTSVRVFVDGNDVTNGVIRLQLVDKNNYMTATTPAFQFVGNARAVSLSLRSPASGGLVSENNDVMRINTTWVRPDGGEVSSTYPISNLPVYPTFQDIPDPQKGVKVRFTSGDRSENIPLGRYSGTYEVTVTPSV